MVSVGLFLFFPLSALAINLPVQFTSQAPYGNWRQPWQDACEETSIVMVNSYYQNLKLDKVHAKKEILNIFTIKEKIYGKSLDENIEKVKNLINNFLSWESTLVENPTLEQIKEQIDQNQPVIVPAYGRALHNKYFKNGGPEYHMLVVSGYDDDKQEFIVQEPGTSRGLDFRYKYDTILNANHDFLPKKLTKNGKKIMLFTKNSIADTKNLDGDKDGLIKADEIFYQSLTWLKDSDGDSFLDGAEVQNGFSPTKKFEKL